MGIVDDNWAGITPSSITGFGGGGADAGSGGLYTGVASAVGTRATDDAPPHSPDNPLFWVALLLLATTGLIAASTHLKIGPVKGSASI